MVSESPATSCVTPVQLRLSLSRTMRSCSSGNIGRLCTELLEIPAGRRDVDGEPLKRQRFELEEEVGLRPHAVEYLTGFHNSFGFCDEFVSVYLATSFEPVPVAHDGPEEAHMTVERWPFEEALAAVMDGRITDGKNGDWRAGCRPSTRSVSQTGSVPLSPMSISTSSSSTAAPSGCLGVLGLADGRARAVGKHAECVPRDLLRYQSHLARRNGSAGCIRC